MRSLSSFLAAAWLAWSAASAGAFSSGLVPVASGGPDLGAHRGLNAEAGLAYYGYRFYNPGLGRWTSRDPLGETADSARNLSRFVGNNPLSTVDPNGLATYQIQHATLVSTDIRMPMGVTPYFSADTWYEQPVAQIYNAVSFAVNFSAGAIKEAWDNPEALGFATMAMAAEAKFIAQGATLVRGGISRCAARNASTLSREAQKGIRSLEQRIAEHEAKLAEFKANPTVRPGMENLPEEIIKKQPQSRIQHVENETQMFKDNIEKLRQGGPWP